MENDNSNAFDRLGGFVSSYKGLVAGLALAAISIIGFKSMDFNNDPLVERVKKIEEYDAGHRDYLPGRYGINMNVYVYRNINDLADSLKVHDQLVLAPGYESREREYRRSDTINTLKALGGIFSGGASLWILTVYSALKIDSARLKRKNRRDKNAIMRI
jgi:hypothetical protein